MIFLIMKKYLSLIVLLSLFLIQIHGVSHSESDQNDKDHHCTICKIVSHQPSLTPAILDVNFSSQLALIKSFQITENYIVPKYFISRSISPRGPPII
jgi:hypothetical protein